MKSLLLAAVLPSLLAQQLSRITSPAPGSVLPPTATFAWTSVTQATAYWLDVGNSFAQGDISAGQLTATAKTVSGLPCDGRPLFVRLWTQLGGSWYTGPNPNLVDYRYTACTVNAQSPVTPVIVESDPASPTMNWSFASPADRVVAGSVRIYRNGLRLGSIDYSLSVDGHTASFLPGAMPNAGDHLIAEYLRQ